MIYEFSYLENMYLTGSDMVSLASSLMEKEKGFCNLTRNDIIIMYKPEKELPSGTGRYFLKIRQSSPDENNEFGLIPN